MFQVDHIALWTPDRDAALEALSRAVGLPIVDGYAPAGATVARGVRFANGPFVDVHLAETEQAPFLGLAGEVRAAETVAFEQDWKARATRQGEGEERAPWSILAFRKGQGLLSWLFVIEYAEDEAAWGSPVFNAGLYHLPPEGGPELSRVWLTAADVAAAGEALGALNYRAAGDVESSVWPHRGRLFKGPHADIVLAEGDDGVVRIDIAADGPRQQISIGPLTAVVGRDSPPPSH